MSTPQQLTFHLGDFIKNLDAVVQTSAALVVSNQVQPMELRLYWGKSFFLEQIRGEYFCLARRSMVALSFTEAFVRWHEIKLV